MRTSLTISCVWATLLLAAALAHGQTGGQGFVPDSFPEASGRRADREGQGTEEFDVRIIGIAFSDIPGLSGAIIETGLNRQQRLIREGDRIGELSVKAIQSDRVVFGTRQGDRITKINHARIDSAIDDATPAIPQPPAVRRPPAENTKIIELESRTLAAFFGDVPASLRQMNINSIAVYGQPIGVRISPIAPGSIFEEMGMETGDIIMAVNGRDITTPEEAIAFLARIPEGGGFDISIRGSRRDKDIQLFVK